MEHYELGTHPTWIHHVTNDGICAERIECCFSSISLSGLSRRLYISWTKAIIIIREFHFMWLFVVLEIITHFPSPSLLSPTAARLLSFILLLHKHNSHFYDYYLHKNHSHNIIYDLDATRKSFIIILHCWRQRELCARTSLWATWDTHTKWQ